MYFADYPAYTHFAGWDVGGWNCEKNRRSRDAFVVLDALGRVIGRHKRGNFAVSIQNASCAAEWVQDIFLGSNCAESLSDGSHLLLAIDAPLGFPEALVKLAAGDCIANPLGEHGLNPYLFRYTEQRLYAMEVAKPLSAVKDMLGSQASKAMHMIARFKLDQVSKGVWQNLSGSPKLTVIETYPGAIAAGKFTSALRAGISEGELEGWHQDDIDALHCALVARLFATERARFCDPPSEAPRSEGWIWIPS